MTTALEPFSVATFTTSDGYPMQFRHYAARRRSSQGGVLTTAVGELPARGQVVAIHGIQSHGGWYTQSCDFLARSGWEVFFLDRRGSGLNERARGDAPNYHRLLRDLDEFIRAYCEAPPFLLSISWGGKLAVAFEHLHPGKTAGHVLVAPGFCPRVHPPFGTRLGIGLARLVLPWKRFWIPLDDADLFTKTPEKQEFIRADPLALRQATARFLVESRRLDWLMRTAHASVRVPVLLLLAGHDLIIDNKRTREYVDLFPTYDARVIEYPSASHTLEFEPDPQPIFRDVERWLEMHRALS